MKALSPKLVAITGIGIIVATILLGPCASPSEFSWIHHTTSEQAGQYMAGAWIMRTGFVAYGLASLLAAIMDFKNRTFVRIALVIFGLGLCAAAVWSNASIFPNVASDLQEDWLHSVASAIVGTGFAACCAASLFAPGGSRSDSLAWAGLLASVFLPLAMGVFPDVRGLVQRTMFAISFVFVGREFAVGHGRKPDRPKLF